jgi:hypothetical protein
VAAPAASCRLRAGGKSCAVRRTLFSCLEQVIVGRSGYVDNR